MLRFLPEPERTNKDGWGIRRLEGDDGSVRWVAIRPSDQQAFYCDENGNVLTKQLGIDGLEELGGVVVGGLVGLLFGGVGVVVGALIGGLLANSTKAADK